MGITRRQKTCITLFASRGCQEFHVLLKRLAFRVAWIHSGSIYILPYTDLSLWFWDLSHSCLWLKPLFCHGGPSRTGEMCVSFRSRVGPCSRNKSNTWNDGFWRTGHATLCHTVSCATPVSRVSRMSPGVRSLSAWRWRWIRRRNRASKSGDAKKLQPLGSRRLKILRILFKIFSLAQRWYVYSKCESKDLSSNHPQSRQKEKQLVTNFWSLMSFWGDGLKGYVAWSASEMQGWRESMEDAHVTIASLRDAVTVSHMSHAQIEYDWIFFHRNTWNVIMKHRKKRRIKIKRSF